MFFCAVSALSFCSGMPCNADGTNLQKVTFMPHWTPQAQFAGFYMAREKGFYAKNGLDVTILPGGPDVSPEENIKTGKVDFITRFLAVALESREKYGLPLVNIGQVTQRSALMLITMKSRGINSIEGLAGKRLYSWPDTQINAVLRKNNLNMRMIPKGNSNALFLEGGADAMSAMWYNEYHALISAGIDTNEMNLFFAEHYGLNFPEDGIYCRAETLADRPGICRAFVTASMEGWKYALAHPDESIDIVMREVRNSNTGSNMAHQRWMLARMRDIIACDKTPMGTLSPSDYSTVTNELLRAGVITNAPPMDRFYVNLATPR